LDCWTLVVKKVLKGRDSISSPSKKRMKNRVVKKMKTQKKSAYETKTATTTKHNKNKNSNTNTVKLLSPIKSSVLILTRPRARNNNNKPE